MIQTFLAEFAAAWNAFIRFPLPAFLSGDDERSEYLPIDGHPALLRIMMPLIGFLLGFLAALPLWAIRIFTDKNLTVGVAGMTVIPLVLEIANSWQGLTVLSNFLDLRRQGRPMDEALTVPPGSINDPRSGVSMILMMTLYLVRMVFCGVLAVFAPFWFMVSLTGAWLVRAELTTLNQPGKFGRPWLAVPRGLGKHHWYVAAGAMLVCGFLYPFGILSAFLVSWAFSWLAKNLCLDTVSGIDRQLMDLFGYSAELVLMFLGILLYASV